MNTILYKIGSVILAIGMTVASWFGVQTPQQQQIEPIIEQKVGADSQLFLGGSTYTIAGSGITSSATSLTLTTLTLPQNGYLIQDADLSETFYMTVEPGNTNRQEFVSCTTVTQNSAGTATLSGCSRGLSPISPYTASTTLQFSHAGGSKLIFSNPPQLYDQAAFKSNDETITGTWDFTQLPTSSYSATSTSQLTTKSYVDAVTNAGAATSTETNGGIVELGTLAEQADSFAGGVEKPTVLQTQYSTSTCQVTGSYNIVASSTSGKLDSGCFDQSPDYIFTGQNIFNTGTTTFQDSDQGINVSSGQIAFNGVGYQWPSVNGATSTSLMTDGSGGLSWGGSSYLIASQVNDVAVSNTSSTTIKSLTISGGTLGTQNVITGKMNFEVTSINSGFLMVGLIYGNENIASTTIFNGVNSPGANILRTGDFDFQIYANGATAQESSILGKAGLTALDTSVLNGEVSTSTPSTSSVDSTINQTLTIWGAWLNSAGTSNFTNLYIDVKR